MLRFKVNKYGFTLVELLAVLVVLYIIMGIAIPNVVSTLDKSKKETYISDAKKFLTQAKTELSNTINKPAAGEIVRINLSCIDNQDLTKDPNGNAYSEDDSFVIIVRKDEELVYYVNLVAYSENQNNRGIRLISKKSLDDDGKLKTVVKNFTIPSDDEIRSITGISGGIRTCGN